jgi:hypothetical protein
MWPKRADQVLFNQFRKFMTLQKLYTQSKVHPIALNLDVTVFTAYTFLLAVSSATTRL